MPVATNVMDAIAGFLGGVNQQADKQDAQRLQALQLLAQQPGASITPAQNPIPASTWRQLLGTPYEPSPSGAPVANVGGQALTVTQAPFLSEAMPDLFATPPAGLETIMPFLGKMRATPQAMQGVANTLLRSQQTAAQAKRADAQIARQDARQKALDEQRTQLATERTKATETRTQLAKDTLSYRERVEVARMKRDESARRQEAGEPLTPEQQTALHGANTLEETTRVIGTFGALPPEATEKPLTENMKVKERAALAQLSVDNSIPLAPGRLENAQTGKEFAQIREEVGGGRKRPTKNTGPAEELSGKITKAFAAIQRAFAGNPMFMIPSLDQLKSPEEKAARTNTIEANKNLIRVLSKQLRLVPGFEDKADEYLALIGDPVPKKAVTPVPAGAAPIPPATGGPTPVVTPAVPPGPQGTPSPGDGWQTDPTTGIRGKVRKRP